MKGVQRGDTKTVTVTVMATSMRREGGGRVAVVWEPRQGEGSMGMGMDFRDTLAVMRVLEKVELCLLEPVLVATGRLDLALGPPTIIPLPPPPPPRRPPVTLNRGKMLCGTAGPPRSTRRGDKGWMSLASFNGVFSAG